MKNAFLIGTVILSAGSMASAALTSQFVPVNNSAGGAALANYVTSDLSVTSTTDWQAGNLLITLTSGSIYQEQFFGSDLTLTPPSGPQISFQPSLAFDSYVKGWDAGQNATGGAGAVDLGGSATGQFNTTGININWFTFDLDDTGTSTIGRFTLSNNATGTWKLLLAANDSPNDLLITTQGAISGGQFVAVPEPMSLGLIASAGMLLLRRRR